jgi:two-component system chemotaxis response regulator CheY
MPLNVLIVDDSAVTRMMIVKTLRATGLELGRIIQAGNGSEGLDALLANDVSLVLADINMPVMNGLEMITSIRENDQWSHLPIIVISTEGSKARIEDLCAMGARFVHKPFSPEAIRDAVMELTGTHNVN